MSVECSSMRDDESAACGRILAASFGRDGAHELSRGPESDVCVIREAGSVRGLVSVRDRRAGFGGCLVRAACLSSLCIDAAERARGLGTQLLASTLRAAFARGIGAAILIRHGQELYTRLGFSRAGQRFACAFDVLRGPAPRVPEVVRGFTRHDEHAWLELAESAARERTGCVVPTVRDRARRSKSPRQAYVVERDGVVVATITVSQRLEDRRMTLYVHELFALDRAACDAAWAFVTSFSAQVRHVRWRASPNDSLADFAHAAGARFEQRGVWMLRLLDARRFLVERGYASGGSFELAFALADPLLAGNERPFTLVVEAGRGRVHEGGRGALTLEIATAASLFSGASSASRLSAAGRLSASTTELERLDAAFALPPAMLQSLP